MSKTEPPNGDPPRIQRRCGSGAIGKYIQNLYQQRCSMSPAEDTHGPVVCRIHCGANATDLGRRGAVPAPAVLAAMSALYWIALLLTLGVFGYLLYAMLNAEKF